MMFEWLSQKDNDTERFFFFFSKMKPVKPVKKRPHPPNDEHTLKSEEEKSDSC